MIYFIKCRGRVKVGFSEDPWRRMYKVSADAPFPCELIGVMDGDRAEEARIHAKWDHLHCHREWFKASAEFLGWIASAAVVKREVEGRKPHGEMCGLTVKRGSKIQIARECGITPGAVSQWQKVPAEFCSTVSRITGIEPAVLRPDLFEGYRTTALDEVA